MDLPFNIWISFVSMCLIVSGIGLWLGVKRIAGAPAITIVGGILLFATTVMTSNIEGVSNDRQEFIFNNQTTFYNQQTSSTDLDMGSATGQNTMIGENIVNSGSLLYQKEINGMQIRIDKDGTPLGDLYVGVWGGVVNPSSTNYKFIIGQMKANATNLSVMDYTFIRNDTKTYRLNTDDVIGVFYNGGTAGNLINLHTNTTASSFDGSNTISTRFQVSTSTWIDSSTADIRARVFLSKDALDINYDTYAFNQNDLWAFMIFISLMIVLIGAVFQKQDWEK